MQRFTDLTDSQLQAQALTMLRRFYGYSSFRPRQLDIIISVLRGRDTVVLMPTGGGKSLTFQIPALMLPGITIVVSPLLSLMNDQVEALIANGIPAATINSLQSEEENRAVVEALGAGHIKLLYISPERLLAEMPRWRADLPIDLIAIDEAHCISRWGHDFRPDYTRLTEIRRRFPNIPIIALTATADRLTRDDIAKQLLLVNPAMIITSFDRPNLTLRVEAGSTSRRRIDVISALIDRYPDDTGIVYCLSRKTTESVAESLLKMGYSVEPYHGAMSTEHRRDVQARFRAGSLQAVVATIAFGMGIDKSNIRWVVHNNMPSCIESYYQEIGRAGRDGLPSQTVMFFNVSDLITLRHFAEESGQSALNLEKLHRMSQYAEAKVCRRRMLLSYFGETLDHDCGNCDVCLNPPRRYDASTPVRKALSAIARTNESVGSSMLIDILRGSSKADLVSRGFHNIKTYGAGRDIDATHWQSIILQMIQLGIVDIAYDRADHLFITDYGRRLLYSSEPVMLTKPDGFDRYKRREREAKPVKAQPTVQSILREMRLQIAAKENIPAYMVMSDPTLIDIAAKMPRTLEQFAAVEGISDRKAVAYWKTVAKALGKADGNYRAEVNPSRYETLFLLRRGNSPAEIASVRRMSISTVYSHLTNFLIADELTTEEILSIIDPATYRKLIAIYLSTDKGGLTDALKDRFPTGLPYFAFELGRRRGELPPREPN